MRHNRQQRTHAPAAPTAKQGGTTVTTLGTGPIPNVDPQLIDHSGKIGGDATAHNPPPPDEPVPPPEQYVVLVDKMATVNGFRTMMRRGKVVDRANYDVKSLAAQGVRMKKLAAGEEPGDVLLETG